MTFNFDTTYNRYSIGTFVPFNIYHAALPLYTEMKITKNKNPLARLQIFYRFLNPYRRVWLSFWKSQTFDKSLENFGSQIFVLRFLKAIGWYGYSYGFCLCFNNVMFIVFTTLKFYKCCSIKDDLQKYFCIIGWCLVRQRNPQAWPYGFKNKSIAQKETHDCDSSADRISRLSPKLSL